jgi:hypothetical protein
MQASTAQNETRLPRAVLRRSKEIEDQLQAQRDALKAPVVPDEPPATPSPQDTPPVAAATPPAPPADPRHADPAYWKARFDTVSGTLTAVKAERLADRERFQQRIDELQAQVRDLQSKAPQAEIDLAAYFTPKQIEDFGEDQCRAMATAAAKAAQESVQRAIEAEVQPLRDQRKQADADAVEDRKQAFKDKLTELVPNFAEIDADPKWIAWLKEMDPDTDEERNEGLQRQISRLNAPGVAKVFKKFEASVAPPAVPVPPVAPPPAGAGGPDTPPAAATRSGYPTPAEIKDFYKRAGLGKVSDAERTTFEARLKLGGRP